MTLTVQWWLLTPAAPENRLRAEKKNNFLILAGALWDSIQQFQFQVYYPTLLKENRYRMRGKYYYNSSEASFLLHWSSFHVFFPNSPSYLVNAIYIFHSTRVYGSQVSHKTSQLFRIDRGGAARIPLLLQFFFLLAQSCDPYTPNIRSIQLNPARKVTLMIREYEW